MAALKAARKLQIVSRSRLGMPKWCNENKLHLQAAGDLIYFTLYTARRGSGSCADHSHSHTFIKSFMINVPRGWQSWDFFVLVYLTNHMPADSS
jgi:hypothetical protein